MLHVHEQDVLHLFAQYGHVQVYAFLCLVYILHVVSRYLDIDIDIIKFSLDLRQILAAHA